MRSPLIMKVLDAYRRGMPEFFARSDAFSIKDLCRQAGVPCRAFSHHADLR